MRSFVLTATVVSMMLVPQIGRAEVSVASTTLISYWSCDETSGVRYDSHGDNDLTDNNTVGYVAGRVGNACDFQRANTEYLSIADASQSGLDFTTDVSLSFWVKKSGDDNAQQSLISKDTNGANNTRSYNFTYNDNGTPSITVDQFPTGYAYPNYYSAYYSVTFTDATWEHYVITIDTDLAGTSNKFYIYKNGSGLGYFTVGDGNGATSFQNTGSSFVIGYTSFLGAFDGALDEISIWNTILSSDDVTELFRFSV